MSNQDVATKNYVDTNPLTTAGGVVSGDIKVNFGSDLIRSIGCDYVGACKKFTLLLGSQSNTLSFSLLNPPTQKIPVKLKAVGGFVILIEQHRICDFSMESILCSRPINMGQNLIKNVKSPVN